MQAHSQTHPDPDDITRLLADSSAGSDEARDRLVGILYKELHSIARGQMAGERSDHTLGATALVSEAYLKLFRPTPVDGAEPIALWADRRAFFAAAVTAMRRVLIDHARARLTEKRGGTRRKMPHFDADAVAAAQTLDPAEFLSLDEAISRLEEVDERAAKIMRLRFFGGLSVEAVADLLGVSERTAIRDWNFARAWLRERLVEEGNS